MIVHQLNLANFRGFEQIELQFEFDVNVIAGVNGVGKSSILDVLAVLFSEALPAFTLSTDRPRSFTDEDIYHSKQSLEASTIFTAADQRYHVGMQRVRGHEEGERGYGFGGVTLESGASPETLQDRKQHPMVIYFSTKRHLPGRPRTLPRQRAFETANAYRFALQDREVDAREFMHWFRVVEYGASRAHRQHTHILDDLRKVVTAFVPEFTNLRIEEHPTLRFVVEKNSTPLALDQLSDGERGLLAVLFDITRRLAIANPGLDNPIAEGKAIILIDEIELHLHPTWQRQVLRRLRNTFKSCQFIVTTHSPQVIGQVRPRCLHLLEYSEQEKRIVVHHTSQSFGMDSNWILQNIMGSLARDYDTEQRLSAAYDKIDEEDLGKARELLIALEADVGLFPDLQEAKSFVDRLELLKSDATD